MNSIDPLSPPLGAQEAGYSARVIPLSRAQDYCLESFEIVGKPDLHGLFVLDDSVVWVSGTNGRVSRTVNGGASWTDFQLLGAEELDFRSIWAFDAKRAIVVSSGCIYRTVDGGSTWQRVLNVDIAGTFFDGVAFWDEHSGVAISDPVNGFHILYRTDDQGLSWHPQVVNIPAIDGEYSFAASNSSLAVCGRDGIIFGTGGSCSRIFSSRDRGLSWQVVESSITTVKNDPYSGIHAISFLNDRVGVAVGGSASTRSNLPGINAIFTCDGGDSWQPLDSNLSGLYLSGVAWGHDNKAIAVDGSLKDYHAIKARNNTIWMVGDQGLCSKLV